MRRLDFHPEAEAELISAASYYERQAPNLGTELLSAIEAAYRRILELPESGRPFGKRLRRVLVPGFPYGLLYRVEADRILVVAVAHLHRRPGYWRSRE